MMEAWAAVPTVEEAQIWTDWLSGLVQSPFALAVLLLVLFAACAVLLFLQNRRWREEMRDELAECWAEHRHEREQRMVLTGFLAESLEMARHLWGLKKSRRLEDKERLDSLELRVRQFHEQEQRELERQREHRTAERLLRAPRITG